MSWPRRFEPGHAARSVVGLAIVCMGGCKAPPSDGGGAPSAPSIEEAAPPPVAPVVPVASSVAADVSSPCEDLVAGGAPIPSYPRGFAIRGLDASTEVAWATARQSGVSFAILQATMGSDPNKAFARNWRMARACGLRRGAYHFLSPNIDAVAQADLYVDRLVDRGDLPPIVDVELAPGCKGPCCEVTCDAWKSTVARVLSRVEERAGTRPIVYTVEPFWKECLCNTSRFANYTLWLAGYPRFDAAPRPGFGGWQRWAFYQAAGNVRLGKGVVDTDVFVGDATAFEALIAKANEAR